VSASGGIGGVPYVSLVLCFGIRHARRVVLAFHDPYAVTIGDAAAPEASLSFLFWGAGLFVLPVICIYTGVVYWVFRGKLSKGSSLTGGLRLG
jgi:cytochrome bd-type quinol oxidase subunit 2